MRRAHAVMLLGVAACLSKPDFVGSRSDAAPDPDALDAVPPLDVAVPPGCTSVGTLLDTFDNPPPTGCGAWANLFSSGGGSISYDRAMGRLEIAVTNGRDGGCASAIPVAAEHGVVLELRGAAATPPYAGVYLELGSSTGSNSVRVGVYAYTASSTRIDYVVVEGGLSPASELELPPDPVRWLRLVPRTGGGMGMIEGSYSTNGVDWNAAGALLAEISGSQVVRIGATARTGATASLQADTLYLCGPP